MKQIHVLRTATRIVLRAVVLASALYLAVHPVQAGMIPLEDNGHTGWHIEFDSEKVFSPFFVGTPVNDGTLDGTLELDHLLFKDLNPIRIDFVQDFHRVPNRVNFGLRITMKLDVTNNSGIAWSGFTMKLIDSSPEFDSGDGAHPGYAHFHNLGADGALNFTPFTLMSGRNPSRTNRGDVYELGNGIFANNTTQIQWSGIGIHQWERPGEFRNFVLEFTPTAIPEPSTLAMMAVGGVGLLGYGWRRRSKARKGGA